MNKPDIDIDQLHGHTNPFTVPEGYFQAQHKHLLEITAPEKRSRIKKLTFALSIAASVAVIATLVVYSLTASMANANLDSYIASLSDTELNNSIAMDDFDSYSECIY